MPAPQNGGAPWSVIHVGITSPESGSVHAVVLNHSGCSMNQSRPQHPVIGAPSGTGSRRVRVWTLLELNRGELSIKPARRAASQCRVMVRTLVTPTLRATVSRLTKVSPDWSAKLVIAASVRLTDRGTVEVWTVARYRSGQYRATRVLGSASVTPELASSISSRCYNPELWTGRGRGTLRRVAPARMKTRRYQLEAVLVPGCIAESWSWQYSRRPLLLQAVRPVASPLEIGSDRRTRRLANAPGRH